MNHKYLSGETFEVIDNIIEVDEDIAKTISVLNKKGIIQNFVVQDMRKIQDYMKCTIKK